jgi:hypothetical protein
MLQYREILKVISRFEMLDKIFPRQCPQSREMIQIFSDHLYHVTDKISLTKPTQSVTLVFGRLPVRISTRIRTALNEIFHAFPRSLKTNTEIVGYIRPQPFLCTYFGIHHSLSP